MDQVSHISGRVRPWLVPVPFPGMPGSPERNTNVSTEDVAASSSLGKAPGLSPAGGRILHEGRYPRPRALFGQSIARRLEFDA